MENLLAVPIGADQIGVSLHGDPDVQVLAGTALNAYSVPPAPVEWVTPTSQAIADDGSVPSDVTTGDPEV